MIGAALRGLSRRLRGRRRRRVLSEFGTAFLVETEQGTFALDPSDYTITNALLHRGAYDAHAIKVLRGLLGPESSLVVVGAHVGSVLIPLAAAARRVLAVEANPRTYPLLRHNLRLNDANNVEARHLAVGAGPGRVQVDHNAINTGNSTVRSDPAGPVEQRALDTLLADTWGHSEEPVDLLVVDVEGSECQVFEGAAHTLARTQALWVEFSPSQLRAQGGSTEAFVASVLAHFSYMARIDRSGAITASGPKEWPAELSNWANDARLRYDLLFTREPLSRST